MILPTDLLLHRPLSAVESRCRGFQPVLVRGPSMVPTLRHGDAVLARYGGRRPRPGDVVLARFRARPDLLVVKRCPDRGRRLVAGGRQHRGHRRLPAYGLADVEARVVLRYFGHTPPAVRRPTQARYARPMPHHDAPDPVFDLHRGGKMAVQATVPLSTRRTSPSPTPRRSAGLRGYRGRQHAGRGVHLDRTHRRSGHRRLGRARPGQHRAARRDAGDGGQSRAVQAVRRCRRGADLPGHPGHRRDHPDRDRAGAQLRRHQPRGHRRPALLRDRAAPRRDAVHPGLPRRPARHRDRGAGGPAQRGPAAGPQAGRAPRRDQRGRGGRGRGGPSCWPAAPPTSSWSTPAGSCTTAGRT